MLGAMRIVERDGVRVDVATPGRVTITATRDLDAMATGRFARPAVGVGWSTADWPADVELLGFAFTQFALPVTAGPGLDFDFRPAPGLRSPRAVTPLIVRSRAGVTMLAPIDHPHEQLAAIGDGEIVWGWHGDLDTTPAHFSTTLGVYEADSVDEALAAWRGDLAPLEGRRDDPVTTHLSYWTDNGAAYWYRTEPGKTIAESVEAAVRALRSDGVPVRAVELDSWAYPHAVNRPIAEIGYPHEVPPTGALRWDPRPDAFSNGDDATESRADSGTGAIAGFARRLDAPLVMHARHIAPTSPYLDDPDEWWIDEHAAQPRDPEFFRRWFDDAARRGVCCIEQDWMLMYWFGVRALRSHPGRAAHWQRALNSHAAATDVDLLWCMATPADLVLAAELDRVVAVRTCDDYRFADDPAFLWVWFLVVNRLANALGLPAFKDCFFSNPDVGPDDDAIDGDPHAELEAALSALSGGPVGIGDRVGRTNREVVLRCCDDDGRLRRVDRAIAAVDECLFGGPARGQRLMWATTTATTPAGEWIYALAIHVGDDATGGHTADRFDLPGERTVYDWRAGTSRSTGVMTAELAPRDWALFIVSPPGAPPADVVGDPSKYVVVEAVVEPSAPH